MFWKLQYRFSCPFSRVAPESFNRKIPVGLNSIFEILRSHFRCCFPETFTSSKPRTKPLDYWNPPLLVVVVVRVWEIKLFCVAVMCFSSTQLSLYPGKVSFPFISTKGLCTGSFLVCFPVGTAALVHTFLGVPLLLWSHAVSFFYATYWGAFTALQNPEVGIKFLRFSSSTINSGFMVKLNSS